jgi:hypothetical protein
VELADRAREREETTSALQRLQAEVPRLTAELEVVRGVLGHTQSRLSDLLGSRTWRWTAWIRAALAWLGGR